MTVLVLAPELDFTADRMVRELEARNVPVVRFDTAWFPQQASLDAELRDGRWTGTLSVMERTIALEEVRSIWYRNPGAFAFADDLSPTERRWAMTETKLGLGGVLAAQPVLWINHPSRNADAAYKPVQLVTAAASGLTVAETLVTNDPSAATRFAQATATVTKAFGSPSIREEGVRKTTFTRRLDTTDLSDLRGIEHSTHQFQHWIPKAYEARVFVVGDNVFATTIHAQSPATHIDWRNDYNALTYARITPPATVAAGVRAFCAAMGLVYAAFDFVVRPDDEWVFLECNAGGQYGWIEDEVELPITAAIADLLEKGNAA